MQTDQPRRAWAIIERIVRPATAGLTAGLIAGAIGGGFARIPMRVAGAMSEPCAGLITENGNPCGPFTVSGTFGLMIVGAFFSGVPGGVVYAAFSPWLRRLGAWRGLVFGVASLLILGFTVFDPGNRDFGRFGSSPVTIAVFVPVFIVFGLVVAPLFDAFERRLPSVPPRRPITLRALIGYVPMAFTVFAILLLGVGSLGIGLLFLAFLAVIHELGDAVENARDKAPPSRRAAYALPLAIAGFGIYLTVRAVADILG